MPAPVLFLLPLMLLSTGGQAADRFDSVACRTALEQLYQVEESRRSERAASGAGGAGSVVEEARRRAAMQCLGSAAGDYRPATARISPPLSVGPIAVPPAANLPVRPMAPLPPPPVAGSRPPATVTQCDSAGCWTSEGKHLMRVGPDLVGPAAMCSIQAGVLQCR